MVKIDATIREAWCKHPDEPVDLIIRVVGNMEEHRAALTKRGAKIRRRFRLTRALGVRCSGKTALELLDLPWITRIEPDRPVKAFRR